MHTFTTRRSFLGSAAAAAACLAFHGGHSPPPGPTRSSTACASVASPTAIAAWRTRRGNAQSAPRGRTQRDRADGQCDPILCRIAGGGKGKDKNAPLELSPRRRRARGATRSATGKCRELRKMYNDAGVNIHIHKLGFGPSDEEIEFSFQVPRRSAASPSPRSATKRSPAGRPFCRKTPDLGRIPQSHQQLPDDRQAGPLLEIGPFIGFNLDIGHYFAARKACRRFP